MEDRIQITVTGDEVGRRALEVRFRQFRLDQQVPYCHIDFAVVTSLAQ